MKIYFTKSFKSQLKKLIKKLPNIKTDFLSKIDKLDLENEIYIGKAIYKIRVKSTDNNKGKSGGLRSYIYLYRKKDLLVPLCIYPKSAKENITENELKVYVDLAIQELAETIF